MPEEIQAQMNFSKDDIRGYVRKNQRMLAGPFDMDGRKRVLIIGDSQAADFVNMIIENELHRNVELRTFEIRAACQPVLLSSISKDQFYSRIKPRFVDECVRSHEDLRNSDRLSVADVVILAGSWTMHGIWQILDTVDYLHSNAVENVFILGKKHQGDSAQDLLMLAGTKEGIQFLSAQRKDRETFERNRLISSLEGNFEYIDLMSKVCFSEDRCHVLTPDGDIIFFDKSHLTPKGAKFLGELLIADGSLDFLK